MYVLDEGVFYAELNKRMDFHEFFKMHFTVGTLGNEVVKGLLDSNHVYSNDVFYVVDSILEY